ncbi:hypothetical protein BDV93DRAFT_520031 [Ceratobasidium sp. AG-I]|nr:hypothetical protein BDV93DRAFT_520031 [Ceratobasidium sp. AG-I]
MSVAHIPSSPPRTVSKCPDIEPDHTTFQPPAGGDQVLQSSDSHEFRVHSLLLALASSTFRKMFDAKDLRGRTIKLEEDRETLSLILQSIYPGKSPVADTLALIRKGLTAAQAYNLEGLTHLLDQQLRLSIHEAPSIFDPLAVWYTAKAFDLTKTQKVAAELVTVARYDFRTPEVLTRVTQDYSEDSALIRLVGIQGARAKVLTDILFAFHQPPMRVPLSTHQLPGFQVITDILLACSNCNDKIANCGSRFSPNWMIWWAHATHEFLMSNSLKAADSLFDPSAIYAHRAVCCQGCLNEFTSNAKLRANFVSWATGVRDVIQQRLAEIETLQLP